MRTQVLLLAALGIAGSATTMAQVYSVNAVGYVNTTLKAGFNLIANPLDNKAGNLVKDILPGVDGLAVYKFVNGAYEPTNAYDSFFGGWSDPAQALAPGEGAFVLLPTGMADTTVTFVGEVVQGGPGAEVTVALNQGFNMISSKVPQAGKLEADLKYAPEDADAVYKWTAGPGGGYQPTVGYDSFFGGWNPGDPEVAVGEAFWLSKAAAGQWKRCFLVNGGCP